VKHTARAFLVAAALALFAPSCVGGERAVPGGGLRATKVLGSITVQAQGSAARTLSEGDIVRPGTRITTGPGARVRLASGEKPAIELGGDTRAALLGSRRMSLDHGSALGETGEGSLSFDATGMNVRVNDGAARLVRGLGTLQVGVYTGEAHVDLLGTVVDVPRFRQQEFSGGVAVDRVPAPLELHDNDPWDLRLLGDVIALDARLTQFRRGFNAEFGTQGADPAFYVAFVSLRRAAQVVGTAQDDVTTADKLIGLVFAQRLASRDGTDTNAGRYFAEMIAEYRLGASWGLIAKERGLDLRLLLPAVLDAISRGTTPEPSGGGQGSGGGGGAQPTSRPTSRPSPGPTPSPTPSPSPPQPPPPPCSILDRLLGNCRNQGAGGSGGSNSAPDCSILGVLLDPEC
jgi:hypothetical protein